MAQLKITQTGSSIRHTDRQKRTLEALGLKRMHQSIVRDDSPQVRGMVARVHHLVAVEEIEPAPKRRAASKRATKVAPATEERAEAETPAS